MLRWCGCGRGRGKWWWWGIRKRREPGIIPGFGAHRFVGEEAELDADDRLSELDQSRDGGAVLNVQGEGAVHAGGEKGVAVDRQARAGEALRATDDEAADARRQADALARGDGQNLAGRDLARGLRERLGFAAIAIVQAGEDALSGEAQGAAGGEKLGRGKALDADQTGGNGLLNLVIEHLAGGAAKLELVDQVADGALPEAGQSGLGGGVMVELLLDLVPVGRRHAQVVLELELDVRGEGVMAVDDGVQVTPAHRQIGRGFALGDAARGKQFPKGFTRVERCRGLHEIMTRVSESSCIMTLEWLSTQSETMSGPDIFTGKNRSNRALEW